MMENYDPIILVTRGDELPKKNYEKKLHPTYETSIRLSNGNQKHLVVKFFDQYRALNDSLAKMGIGYGLAFPIDAEFPPTHASSKIGLPLSEDALGKRCYMLNKWMQAIFNNYHRFPEKAQLLISEFLSLEDRDEAREKNKNYILDMIKKKNEIKLNELIQNNNEANRTASAAANARSSDRTSEESPLVLTAEAIQEYSQPQVVNDYLRVSCVRQFVDSKNRYETTIQLLPFQELGEVPHRTEIDINLYNDQVSKTSPIIINKPFDGYRQLKIQLADVGVFGRDKNERFTSFNEDGTKPYRGVKLDVEFPKTYAQSSFGLVLNEEQLKTRAALLNRWVITVLRSYKQLNQFAQEAIRHFLEIDKQHELYLSILNSTYETPKLPIPPGKTKGDNTAVPAKRNSLLSALLPGGGNNKEAPTTNPSSYAPVNISAAPTRSSQALVASPDNEDDRYSTVSSMTDAPSPSSLQVSELQKEIIVKDYLVVSVTKGDMLAKKKDEGKKHHGYLTQLRIRYYDEIENDIKPKIDKEAYNSISMYPAKSILKVFDGYRQLKTQLEEKNIFGNELREKGGKERLSSAIIIQASFPRTYTRSSLGLSLGENEIKTRTAELNYWVGRLLLQYSELPADAQELINEFFNLDDSPAEAENAIIVSILKGTFSPPLIDESKKKKKGSDNNRINVGRGNSGTPKQIPTVGGGSGSKQQPLQLQDEEEEEREGQPPRNGQTQSIAQGCACIIM